MRTRVKQRRELERLVGYLAGEIRYRREILSVIFLRICPRCNKLYSDWLSGISARMSDMSSGSFERIWEQEEERLYFASCLSRSDMEYVHYLGQVLGYLDVQAQEEGLHLLQEELMEETRLLEREMKNRMRLSVALFSVVGLFVVLLLL